MQYFDHGIPTHTQKPWGSHIDNIQKAAVVHAATSYNMASKSHNLILHPLRVPDVEPSKGGVCVGIERKGARRGSNPDSLN